MTPANTLMKKLLSDNGIDATPKYIEKGSMKHTWRIYNDRIMWHNNPYLWDKLTELGFTDYDDKPLNKFSGNGGLFSIFVRYNGNNTDLKHPLVYNLNNLK